MSPTNPHCRIGKIKSRGNVQLFPGVTRIELGAEAQPQPRVIAFVEDLLDRARRGEIQAIAVAFVLPDRSTADAWRRGGFATSHPLMGAVSYLHQRLAADANATSIGLS